MTIWTVDRNWTDLKFIHCINSWFECLDKWQDKLSDKRLKMLSQTMTLLASFWIHVKAEYPGLAEISLKVLPFLLPFPFRYRCETAFSAMSIIKTKYRSSMHIQLSLWVAMFTIKPWFDKFVKYKQAHLHFKQLLLAVYMEFCLLFASI